MPPDPRHLGAEELLRLDGWLQRLVRSLSAEDAEDVAQDAWVAALAQAPLRGRLGTWLEVVARNFARRRWRARRRRREREARAARPEALPSTEATLELLELQQRVARAVSGLREPYRTAVLLRYVHGLATDAIAERTGTTPANVRQRVKRGLDLLRVELRERHGEAWCGAPLLALLDRAPVGASALSRAVIPMKLTKTTVAAAGVLLAVSGVVLTALLDGRPGTDPARGEGSAAAERPAAPAAPVDAALAVPENGAERERAGMSPPAAEGLAPVTGRVVDRFGRPLAAVGLAVVSDFPTAVPPGGLESPEPTTESAANGTFSVETESERGRVAPASGWVPLADSTWFRPEASERRDKLIVVASAVELAGIVVDGQDRPLAGVTVRLDLRWVSDFPDPLAGTSGLEWSSGATDAEGRFRHRDLPGGAARLVFTKEGFTGAEVAVGESDETALRIVLEPSEEAPYVLSGWVAEPSGAPVAAARVGLGEHTGRADEAGRFELSLPADAVRARQDFYAAQAGWQTAVIARAGKRLLAEEDRRLELEIVMAGPSLALAGRVLDAAGAPVSDIYVYLWGEPALGNGLGAEELAVPTEAPTLEAVHVIGASEGLRVWSRTDEQGRFRLEGLRDREYRLRLYDRGRHAAVTVGPLRAGAEDVVLTLPSDFTRRLEGRVVDLAGRPVAGASVTPMLMTYTGSMSGPGEDRRAVTDEEGRFVFEVASRRDLSLTVWGEGLMHDAFGVPVPEDDPGTDLELRVERRCDFRLVLTDPDRQGIQFQVHDASDQPMQILAAGGGEYMSTAQRGVSGGRTRVLTVGESAATLVLLRWDDGWQELDRLPLSLRPGEVNEIRW